MAIHSALELRRFDIDDFSIESMSRNSLILSMDGKTYFIHRRIFNKAKAAARADEPFHLYPVTRDYRGTRTTWLATLSTL